MLRLQPYVYHRPRTVDDALEVLGRHTGEAMPIAGGTDLMPNMKHGLFAPGHLVALRGIQEIHGITVAPTEIRIGAGETLGAVASNPLVASHFPSLAKAAGNVAGPQIRNAGTIGGNLCLDTRCTYYNQSFFWRNALGFCLKKDGEVCHVTKVGKKCVAANSADTVPPLITLGAVLDLVSAEGERSVPVEDFFVADGIANTVRRPGELVTAVRITLPPAGRRTAFVKLRQRGSIDFPLLNVAVVADFAADEVSELRIVISALGSRPRVVTGLDRIAHGHALSDEIVEAVAQRAFQQCHPLENIIVDPDWRRAMVPVHVRRALADIRAGA